MFDFFTVTIMVTVNYEFFKHFKCGTGSEFIANTMNLVKWGYERGYERAKVLCRYLILI